MGKINELNFPEVMINSSNKIPNDPEASFKTFADIISTVKRTTPTGATIQMSEIGPHESLSSIFQADIPGTGSVLKITIRYIINPKSTDIGYEVNITNEKGEKKPVLKLIEMTVRTILTSIIENAYDSAIGEDFTLGSKKAKKKKVSKSEKYLAGVLDPEGKDLTKTQKKSVASMKETAAKIAAEKVTDGSMCYLHPDVAADVLCDICKKPICPDCLQNPLSGQKLYLKSKKELAKVPFSVCPNCVKEAKKKYGPTSWSQIRGYMASH